MTTHFNWLCRGERFSQEKYPCSQVFTSNVIHTRKFIINLTSDSRDQEDPVSTICKRLVGPIILLSWSGLVWKSCFTYGFDHWDTVNNYSLVYEAILAWLVTTTNDRPTRRPWSKPAHDHWPLKRQNFAIPSFLSSDCVMFTWFDHLEETFPSSCFLYNRLFLRRDQLTQ